jgi:hypothetical protein
MSRKRVVLVIAVVLVVTIASAMSWLVVKQDMSMTEIFSKIGITKNSDATVAIVPIITDSTISAETTLDTESASTTTTTTTSTTVPTVTTLPETLCIRLGQCQFANLADVDFSSLQLSSNNFSAASLVYGNFTKANLEKAIFTRADLRRAIFVSANLTGVDFTKATMTDANLEGATLTDAIFCDVDFKTLLGTTESQLAKIKKFKSKDNIYCP